jgi:Fe-S cluster biogenesis protein NfuA
MFGVAARRGRLGGRESTGTGRSTVSTGGRTVDSQEAAQQSDDGPVDGAATPAVVSDDERADRLSQLNSLIELMRPAVQADGGDLALLFADVVTGVVEVQLQGACSSCAVSSSTLQGGVDRILHDRLPWVTEVRGGVDESVDPFESESMGRGGYVPSF